MSAGEGEDSSVMAPLHGWMGCRDSRLLPKTNHLLVSSTEEPAFNALIGNEPDGRHQEIHAASKPGMDARQADAHQIQGQRQPLLAVRPDRFGQRLVALPVPRQGAHQHRVCNGAHEQDRAVQRHRHCCKLVFAHPAAGKGNQRQPEQEMQVGPQHLAADAVDRFEEVMVIVPVNADVDEAEDIAHEDRPQRDKRLKIGFVRDFEFQHHDGDGDGDDAVAECFASVLTHHSSFADWLYQPPDFRAGMR
jgi:hypothetical protein